MGHYMFVPDSIQNVSGVSLIKFELALLDRLLYKNQNRFRNDRGFKALKILQKSAQKFIDRFPTSVLTNLSSLMPVGIPPVELRSTESVSILLPPPTIPQYTAIHVWASSLMAVRWVNFVHVVKMSRLLSLKSSETYEVAFSLPHDSLLAAPWDDKVWAHCYRCIEEHNPITYSDRFGSSLQL